MGKSAWTDPVYHCDQGRSCYVWHKRKKIFLGPWDGKSPLSPAVAASYARTCEWLREKWEAERAGAGEVDRETDVTLAQAVGDYLSYLKTDLEGALRPDGSLSTLYERSVMHLRPLARLFGDRTAAGFTAADFRLLRNAWLHGTWWQKETARPNERPPKKWSISTCNTARTNVIRLFGWLESQGLIPVGRTEHLKTLQPLKHHETREAPTVADMDVEAVLRHTSPQIAAMVRLQRITAARPSELCTMRPADIDRGGPLWVYKPRQHKTRWRGLPRLIPLSKECQEILAPFLFREPDAFLFSPREAVAWWNAQRAAAAGQGRKTPIYPSEIKARAKRKQKRQKTTKRKQPGNRYTQHSYRQAIKHAIARARRGEEEVTEWLPYALRHTRITEVQAQYGWDDAQAVAGHESSNTTRRYAHERHQRALRIAAEAQKPRRSDAG